MAATRANTPSTSAYAPQNNTSTVSVRPGQAMASAPNKTAARPRSRNAHQWRDDSMTSNMLSSLRLLLHRTSHPSGVGVGTGADLPVVGGQWSVVTAQR